MTVFCLFNQQLHLQGCW